MQRTQLPTADLSSTNFGERMNDAWSNIGFVSITGYDSRINDLKARVYTAARDFFNLPEDVKRNYYFPDTGGQRGYTPDGVEYSGGRLFREYREHVMVGPRLEPDHPARSLQPHFFQDNPNIKETPDLIPASEELLEALEELDLLVFTQLAPQLGLPKEYFASRIAHGSSVLRLHHYPKVEGEILEEIKIGNVDALKVRFPNGDEVNNLVRTGIHTDVDFSAALLGAEAPGLWIQGKDRIAVPYTANPNEIVFNAGDFAAYETNGVYPASPHWVGLTRQTAKTDRLSVVRFTHFRPRSNIKLIDSFRSEENLIKYPDTFNGVLLFKRLQEIGYITEAVRDYMIDVVRNRLNQDDDFVKEILEWEKTHRVDKLSRYF